ncbi:MAG: S46 family peptidase [Planctomycetaceae bacterium]|nr:S46 family peptidase [Planctomycetaceae bacterium]
MKSAMKYTIALFLVSFLVVPFLRADEGMWLFDAPPKTQIKEKYGFDLTGEWLKHIQQSCPRFSTRGSASFVSSGGLIMTNHHVGARNLHELSTPENNLLEKGFYAETLADERPCPGLEIIVPVLSEDVTAKVNAGVKPNTPPEQAKKLRDAAVAALEKEYSEKTKLRCNVTTLYQGGVYYLYGYKVYNDIRLVWAPEQDIASFGGDPDNYEYPRYCLDCTFFRAYENGQPAKVEHFLKWSQTAPAENELVFVAGYPGRTERAYTKEHLEFQRDTFFPWRLRKLYEREVIYSAFANRSLENARRIGDDLGAVQNYRKRALGQLQGLQTPSLWRDFPSVEKSPNTAPAGGRINRRIVDGGRNKPAVKSPEQQIADACKAMLEHDHVTNISLFYAYDFFEAGEAFNCKTFQIAKTLVRAAYELEKPNGERLKEYRDNNLDTLKQTLFADTPVYEDVEILKLSDSLTLCASYLEKLYYPYVSDKAPAAFAAELIKGSKVRDVAERKRLFEGGRKAVEASDDAMIRFVRKMDKEMRNCRKQYEEKVEAPMAAAYAELAERRFAESGTSVYPDATFTIRLSYGAVRGYKDDSGADVAATTNIAGMFERAETQKFKEPFNPPQRWKEAKGKLDLSVPFNLVTTNDIIGGNSGSPLINTKGEVVGLIFDGNIYSLSNSFVYTEEQSRSVSVHAAVILESLRKVYGAARIADELGK